MPITFRPLAVDDLSELRSWFEDAELSRRLSFPTDDWFSYVTAGDAANCWVALNTSQIIGQIQVDGEGTERGFLDIAVRPDLKRRGFGSKVLSAFLSGPGLAFPILEGRIEQDNVASLALCRRCGFIFLPEPDADGFIQAIYYSSRNSRI